MHPSAGNYRIAGKFGGEFNLAVWRIVIAKFKSALALANNKHDVMHTIHAHMYMRAHAGLSWTEFFMTALALYSSVKQVEVGHIGWSYRMVPLHLKNSEQTADIFRGTWPTIALLRITRGHSVGIPSFLARSSILPLWLGSKYFRKMVALNTAVACRPPKSPFSISAR